MKRFILWDVRFSIIILTLDDSTLGQHIFVDSQVDQNAEEEVPQ